MNKDFHDPIEPMGEILGQMHGALEAFNQRLGEVMAQLRLTTHEQRAEGTQALQSLRDIAQQAKRVAIEHQQVVKLIERQWPERMDAAARESGHAQAQAFGEAVVRGIQTQLSAAGEHATRSAQELRQTAQALHWKTTGLFGAALLGFAAAVVLSLWAWSSSVRTEVQSLRAERAQLTQTIAQLKDAGGELDSAHCTAGDDRLCVHIDPEQRFGPRKDYALVKYRTHP